MTSRGRSIRPATGSYGCPEMDAEFEPARPPAARRAWSEIVKPLAADLRGGSAEMSVAVVTDIRALSRQAGRVRPTGRKNRPPRHLRGDHMTTHAITPMRTGSRASTATAVVGGVTAVVYLVAFALSPTGTLTSTSTGVGITHFASVHRDQLLASDLLISVGLVLLMVFAAALYRMLRRAEGNDGWLAIASLASAVSAAGVFGAGTALFMAVAYRPATDPAVARALWDAGWLAYNSAGFGFAIWIVLVTVATARDGALPKWTVWIGGSVALVNLVGPLAVKAGSGPFSPQGSFASVVGLTFAVWVIAICLAAWQSARVQR